MTYSDLRGYGRERVQGRVVPMSVVALPSAWTRVESENASVVQTGTWSVSSNAEHFGGSALMSSTTGNKLGLTFTGTGIRYYAFIASSHGIQNVYIDGVKVAEVDHYSATVQYRVLMFEKTGLSSGQHTIEVEISGTTSGSNYVGAVDAFEVGTSPAWARIESNDAGVTATGTWTTQNNVEHSGGSSRYSNTLNDRLSYTFTGTGIRYYTILGAGMGIHNIYIDAVQVGTFDAYAAANQYQYLAFEHAALASGQHTIEVEVSGTKNASSAGTYVQVDAFEVGT